MRRELVSDVSLYLVTDASPRAADLDGFLTSVIEAGVGMVQLRDRSLNDAQLLDAAKTFSRVCRDNGALFIVNDRIDIAMLAGADGVHVGQDDVHPDALRVIGGDDFIIGLSTHSPEQIALAGQTTADYIGVGPVFATPTKAGRPAVGLELVRHAAQTSQLPFFAIGGIDRTNIHDVRSAGARAVSVLRCVAQSDDPEAAVRALLAPLAGLL